MKQWAEIARAPRRTMTLTLVALLVMATLGGWPSHFLAAGAQAAVRSADASCPSPWTCADIGNPTPPGSQTYNNGTWQISGGGKLFYGSADQDRFVYQPLTGDGSIQVHLITQTVTSPNARAGLMWRQSADPQAPFYALYATPSDGLLIKYRMFQGDSVHELRPWTGAAPIYFQVTRTGTTFASYISSDGANWFFIPESAFTLPSFASPAIVGMFVNSDNASKLSTATFDSFHLLPLVSGTFSDSIASQGGASSYSFTPGASGPISVGSCAVNPGYVFDVSLTDSNGTVLGSGSGALTCNYLNATVSAGQAYTVTTTAAVGTGAYRSAWSINGAQVVWNLSGAGFTIGTQGGSQTVSFPTLSANGIALSTCGPAGANFDLYLKDTGGHTLASSTSSSNCESLSYTPSARGLFRLVETSVTGTGAWTGTITTEIPSSTPTPTPTPTNTPVPAAASGTHAGTIAATGGSDSYTFTPGASGVGTVGSCSVTTGYIYDVSLYNSQGNLVGTGTTPSNCNWINAALTAGHAYTVTTTSVSGTGAYRSAWNVNGAQVVWNLTGTGYKIGSVGGSQTFSFPTLSAGGISISSCGPAGSNFDLYLTSAGGTTLASSTSPSNCESVSYTPGARGLFRLKEVSVSGTGLWSATITTEIPVAATPTPTATKTPQPTNTPQPTATPTSTPPVLSGMHSGTIAATDGSDSYTFTPGASGPATVGSCAVTNGYIFTVSVYDSHHTLLGSSANPNYCNWVDTSVTMGQTYTVSTTAVAGSGLYRAVWNVNGAQVVWTLTGPGYSIGTTGGSQSVSFPILSTGPITLSTCGPSGANFDLYLTSSGGATLASSTSPSNCETIHYTPSARDLYRLKEVAVSGPGSWSGSIITE